MRLERPRRSRRLNNNYALGSRVVSRRRVASRRAIWVKALLLCAASRRAALRAALLQPAPHLPPNELYGSAAAATEREKTGGAPYIGAVASSPASFVWTLRGTAP